jgi:hypothetical protein
LEFPAKKCLAYLLDRDDQYLDYRGRLVPEATTHHHRQLLECGHLDHLLRFLLELQKD